MGKRSASRSEAVMVAVGFSPRIGRNEEWRRGATLESCLLGHQASLRDARSSYPRPWAEAHGLPSRGRSATSPQSLSRNSVMSLF